jgi:hypothetical protein
MCALVRYNQQCEAKVDFSYGWMGFGDLFFLHIVRGSLVRVTL